MLCIHFEPIKILAGVKPLVNCNIQIDQAMRFCAWQKPKNSTRNLYIIASKFYVSTVGTLLI